VDCGTQSLRAMLFSGTGKLVDKAKVEYEPYLSPRPGWAEQDPGVCWGAQLKDPAAKGSMIGLGEAHTRGFLYRSLIEGLAFALRDGLERLERAGRSRCERIGLAGGAAQSEEICQITADIFGRPLCRGETFEAAGLYRKLYLKVHRRIQRRLEPLHAEIRQILDCPERSAGAVP
jgi:sugar (pentulose or hexulose) kinase